jgi:hypothetical protein
MPVYLPHDWPAEVLPPGSEDFEASAVSWLLDVLAADYSRHPVLRRYPAALASIARHHAHACLEGARRSYGSARVELAVSLPPHAVDGVLAAYKKEGFALAATARAVDLVEWAIRGETFAPRLSRPLPGEPHRPPLCGFLVRGYRVRPWSSTVVRRPRAPQTPLRHFLADELGVSFAASPSRTSARVVSERATSWWNRAHCGRPVQPVAACRVGSSH